MPVRDFTLAARLLAEKSRKSRKVRTQLLLLAAACVVPVILFAAVLVAHLAGVQSEAVRQEVRQRAHLLAEDIDREVDRTRAAVLVLAVSHLLQIGDLAGFYDQTLAVRDRLGTNVVLRNLAGQQLVNTRVAWGTKLPANSADVDSRVVETRQPQVSGVFIGGLTRTPLLVVVAPVVRGDAVVYLLSLTITPERLSAIVASARLPAGWSAALYSENGTVIADSEQGSGLIGTRAPPEMLGQLRAGGTDVFRIERPDGGTALQTFGRADLAGWSVGVTVPGALVAASARQDLLILAAGGMVLLGAGLGIAAALGRRLTLPMVRLEEAARLLGAGRQPTLPECGITELDVIGRAYEAAANLIAGRTTALRARTAELETVLGAVPALVWITHDVACSSVTGSHASYEFLRLPAGANPSLSAPEGERPAHFTIRTDGQEMPAEALPLQRAARGETIRDTEIEVAFEDGSSRWIFGNAVPLMDDDGRARGAVSAFVDVTDRKRAEASLRDSQIRLQTLQSELLHVSRLTDMGQMAAALAHEINQPLASAANLLGGCRLLLERGDANPDQVRELRQKLALASDQTLRAGEIIRRLRNFLSRGETERRLESAKEVLQEACALALVGVPGHGITVRTEFNTNAQALVDRVQMQQVLVNLVRNAVDAMRATPRKELTIQVSERDAMVETCVSDTGEGVPADVAKRLFEPFASTKAHGMGIGLSVCRKIVEDHGGKIAASPRPGGGTTFCFTIPVARVTCHAD